MNTLYKVKNLKPSSSINFLFKFLLNSYIYWSLLLLVSNLNNVKCNIGDPSSWNSIMNEDVSNESEASSNKPLKPLELTNEYLREFYYKTTTHLNRLVLNDEDYGQLVNQYSILNKSYNFHQVLSEVSGPTGRYAKSIEISGLSYLFDKNSLKHSNETIFNNLIELFFPENTQFDNIDLHESKRFQLEFLNLTGNSLNENFLDNFSFNLRKKSAKETKLFNQFIFEYFSHLLFLKLSLNKLKHLERKHFVLFSGWSNSPSKLETILLDSNELKSIRHDTFYDLKYLKFIDLKNNQIKLIHPLTFSISTFIRPTLTLIDLSNNKLKAVFNSPIVTSLSNVNQASTNNYYSLINLKYLYLSGNNQINCDCGLIWLYRQKEKIYLDNFTCNYNSLLSSSLSENSSNSSGLDNSQKIKFISIKNETFLKNQCKMPNLIVNTEKLQETSTISLFRSLSKRWFAWTVFVDILPVTTPYPYLMSNNLDELDENKNYSKSTDNEQKLNELINQQDKHVFHSWRMSDVVFDCTNRRVNEVDDSNSAIIWKTQYGYLSYIDEDLMNTLRDLNNFEDQENNNSSNVTIYSKMNKMSFHNSFKIFYKMNRLTKISRNFTVKVGLKFGGYTLSEFSVNSQNQLSVTNLRQITAGPFVCISLNERGIRLYEYDLHVRAGVGEYFIYCLMVSVISSIIPSIIGIIMCCICEYQAKKNYPMTPPCYPTPMANTPPNFDFNEWMSNAASYLPNLNIHETLEQVSKKLRKGMEKASVTVKSLGLTSSAYIYSMYEQSSQRWSDIKSYVPSLNVPTLNLPTMKYPPVGQFANKMRAGMGSMFIQLREFCGTSDLTHTASIVDIESDTNASNAVGKAYIIDQIDLKQQQNQRHTNNHFSNYYKLFSFIREEYKNEKKMEGFNPNNCLYEEDEQQINAVNFNSSDHDETQPTTSAIASGLSSKLSNSTQILQIPKLNILVKFIKSSNRQNDIDEEDEDEYDDDEDECQINENKNKQYSQENRMNNEEKNEYQIEKKDKETEPN